MKIRPEVKSALKELGYTKLRKGQSKVINRILDRKDTLLIAKTSFGKTLTAVIPAVIHRDRLTVIIEPLTVLMHEQVKMLNAVEINAAYLDSTQSDADKSAVYHKLEKQKMTILYVSPERLPYLPDWIANQIWLLVVDECHCVTLWGNSFREAYSQIGLFVSRMKKKPAVLAMSASAPPEDYDEIASSLGMENYKVLCFDLFRSKLHFLKYNAANRKEQLQLTKKMLRKYHKAGSIVFCSTIEAVKAVAENLERKYPNQVAVYYGKDKRSEKALLSGEKTIVVATNALAMGVDLPNVDLVIHFNMPSSISEYYQMAGRAGRNGQKAHDVLLYNPKDFYSQYRMIEQIKDKKIRMQELARLESVKELCEDSESCIVRQILRGLGQERDTDCRYCTNCQKERRKAK